MTTQTMTLKIDAAKPAEPIARLLAWVIEADRRYREAVHLRDLPQYRLDDVDLTRARGGHPVR